MLLESLFKKKELLLEVMVWSEYFEYSLTGLMKNV